MFAVRRSVTHFECSPYEGRRNLILRVWVQTVGSSRSYGL
jgi:hypothetical protein